MITTKFTPTPWILDGDTIRGPVLFQRTDGTMARKKICSVSSPEDAPLLLHAPNMYKELEAIQKRLARDKNADLFEPEILRINDLLQKARG